MVAPTSQSASSVSPRQRRANRRNAKKSTGPQTAQGKARSARNAVTHGIFCRDLVLATEDAGLFLRIRRDFLSRLRPQDLLELSFVERIAESQWKLMRLARSEADLLDPPPDQDEHDEDDDSRAKKLGAELVRTMLLNGSPSTSRLLGLLQSDDEEEDMLYSYSTHRQRLELSISRALRELLQLRKTAADEQDLPPSPFLDVAPESNVQADSTECDQLSANVPECPEMPRPQPNVKNEPISHPPLPTPVPAEPCSMDGISPSPGTSQERRGEGSADVAPDATGRDSDPPPWST